ncbi:MAG: hypothetical protein Q7K55_07130, partial [Candidatus Levybacteria bacterium]|nr:hypothetical protein [Candidatus Levybacteria bacterium]
NIGFDLDKVLISYPFFIPDFIIDKTYKIKVGNNVTYRIPSRPEQLLRLLLHFPLLRQSVKKNMEFVKDIAKKNSHNYFLITGRFNFLEKRTNQIIKKYGLDKVFKKIFINSKNEQPHVFKSNLMKQLKIDKYVDDDLFLLKYAAGENPKTKFFWLNKKISKKLKDNLFAIKNISEMFA